MSLGRYLMAGAMFLAAVPVTGTAHADDDHWVGFYNGIDNIDGSLDQLSIVDTGDGNFDIRMRSSGLGLCDDGAGAGWMIATGRVVDDDLMRENAVFRCNGSDEEIPFQDTPYTRDDDTGILTLRTDSGRTIHFHPTADR